MNTRPIDEAAPATASRPRLRIERTSTTEKPKGGPCGDGEAPRRQASGSFAVIRVGTDAGGTFTDLIGFEEKSGNIYVGKALTTPKANELMQRAMSEPRCR
jgi:hypothetical protein